MVGNGSGIVDAASIPLASGKFNADNGTTLLNLSAPSRVEIQQELIILVTAHIVDDLGSSALPSGAAPLVLAFLLPFTLLGARSRRVRWLVIALLLSSGMLWFPSCGGGGGDPNGGGGPQPQTKTYQVSVTGIEATRTDSAAVTFDGLPVAGTTLAVTQ